VFSLETQLLRKILDNHYQTARRHMTDDGNLRTLSFFRLSRHLTETSLHFYQTTRCHATEDGNIRTPSFFRVNRDLSETSINFYETTRYHMTEDGNLHTPALRTFNFTEFSLTRNRNFKALGNPGLRLTWSDHFVVSLSFDCMKITSG
jgi:hypothetical protein